MGQMMKVAELKPHPMNNVYFSDMDGHKWEEFLKSIKSMGVQEAIVISQDKTIVSGHQRVRACKALGIEDVEVLIHFYNSDLEMEVALIETNVKQRGEVGGTAEQIVARYEKLCEYYGLKKAGRPSEKSCGNSTQLSKNEIAGKAGTSYDDVRDARRILKAIPELRELIDTGVLKAATVRSIASQLSDEEQMEFVQTLPAAQKFTQKEAEAHLRAIQGLQEKVKDYETTLAEAQRTLNSSNDAKAFMQMKKERDEAVEKERKTYEELQANIHSEQKLYGERMSELTQKLKNVESKYAQLNKDYNDLRDQGQIVETKTVEVMPSDYEELKRKAELYDRRLESIEHSNAESKQGVSPQEEFESTIIGVMDDFLVDIKDLLGQTKFINALSDGCKDKIRSFADEMQLVVCGELEDVANGNGKVA